MSNEDDEFKRMAEDYMKDKCLDLILWLGLTVLAVSWFYPLIYCHFAGKC